MFKKRIWIVGIIIAAFLIFIPVLAFKSSFLLNSELSVDGLLSYIIGALSAFGTIFLAVLALHQTEIQQKQNEESQKRLEKLTSEANAISRRMLDIEEEKNRPFVDINAITDSDDLMIKNLSRIDISFTFEDNYFDTHKAYCDETLDFDSNGFIVTNIQDYNILEMGVRNIEYNSISYKTGNVIEKYALHAIGFSNIGSIKAHENILLYLPFPMKIWSDIAELSFNYNEHIGLEIILELVLMGNHGSEYIERIQFTTANVIASGMKSLFISNKQMSITRKRSI